MTRIGFAFGRVHPDVIQLSIMHLALTAVSAQPRCPVAPPLSASAVFLPCQVTTEMRWSLSNEPPRFPALAADGEIEGLVRLRFIVDSDGAVTVRSVKVIKSPHDVLTSSAVAAVRKWHGEPARIGHAAVAELVTHDFLFLFLDKDAKCPTATFADAGTRTFVCFKRDRESMGPGNGWTSPGHRSTTGILPIRTWPTPRTSTAGVCLSEASWWSARRSSPSRLQLAGMAVSPTTTCIS